MSRRKPQSLPVKMVRFFDHVPSPLVDVQPNEDGEFVQVWNVPRGGENRFVTFSYQRTPVGPMSIRSRLNLAGGNWSSIETTGPRRTYYYAGDARSYRYEEILPSGRLLVIDEPKGIKIREVWTESFDWDVMNPAGKPLSAKAVSNRQKQRLEVVVSTYQQTWADGKLESEALICVAVLHDQDIVKFVEIEAKT